MSYTKGELLKDMFNEIGLGDYTFDLEPERFQSALRQMDRLAGRWVAKGIPLDYPIPSSPTASKLEDDSLLTTAESDAMIFNLSLLTAPSFGKIVSPDTRLAAKQTLDVITLAAAIPREKQLPVNVPVGSGYKENIDFPFTPLPVEEV